MNLPGARNVKRAFAYFCLSFLVYLSISLILTFWPIPLKQSGDPKTLDFRNLPIMTSIDLGSSDYYTARDGKSLFYRFYKSTSHNLLILLHGSSGEGRYFIKMASAIADSGVAQVAVLDLRGHGYSAYRRGDIEYIGQYEDDIQDFIGQYKKKYGDAKIILGGHSSGGGLAVRYGGNKNLPKVNGFLLFAPYLAYDAPTTRPHSGGWVTPNIKRIIGLTLLNNFGIHYFNHLPVLHFNRPAGDRDALKTMDYSYRLNVSYAPRHYKKDLENIAVPIYVMVGRNDDALYADHFEGIFKSHTKNSRVEIIPGTDHMGLVGNDQVIKSSIDWLKSR